MRDSNSLLNRYKQIVKYRYLIFLLFIILIFCTLVLDFILGPAGLTISTLYNAVITPESVPINIRTIVWDIRLPYALMAIIVGLSLGLAGAEMQTILNNSLASPYTLGISDAAAFGAALAIILDITIPYVPGQWIISANAFIFSLLAAMLLDLLTRLTRLPGTGIILFGIALVFTFKAMVSMMQFVAAEDKLQSLVLWTMGNITRATWEKLTILFIIFVIALVWSMRNSWRLTALRLGDDRAATLGINTRSLRLTTLVRVSLVSATAVAFVGPIGFIGLVGPHIARILFGEDHRFYLPASALIGALVLSIASIISKNIVHGVVIPVGVVTSIVGVPFFITIVLRFRGRIR